MPIGPVVPCLGFDDSSARGDRYEQLEYLRMASQFTGTHVTVAVRGRRSTAVVVVGVVFGAMMGEGSDQMAPLPPAIGFAWSRGRLWVRAPVSLWAGR